MNVKQCMLCGIHVHDVKDITISVDFLEIVITGICVHQLLWSSLLVMTAILSVYQSEM